MASSYPLKPLQQLPLLRLLIRPMLFLSLGLHALLLLTPFPTQKPVQPEKKEEKISLTQISPHRSPAPAAKSSPTPRVAVTPRPIVRPTPLLRPIVRPAPQAIAPPAPRVSPSVQAAPPPSPTADPFAIDFPLYPHAQPGSFGLPAAFDPSSQKTTDAADMVSAWYHQQLQAKGFVASPVNQTGRQVYQVSKDGKTKFLNLIPNATGAGTSIVLSDQPLPDDLGSGRVISPEEQSFYSDLAAIVPDADPTSSTWQEIDNPTILPEANAFYDNLATTNIQNGDIPTPRQGIERKMLAVGQDAQAIDAELEQRLKTAQYEITPKGNYGGGALYQITRDQITGYLSVVGTPRGTAVFVWSRSPI